MPIDAARAVALRAMLSDPGLRRDLFGGRSVGIDAAARLWQGAAQAVDDAVQPRERWAVLDAELGRCVGAVGWPGGALSFFVDAGEQGRGWATAALAALMSRPHRPPVLRALTLRDNRAARAVLERAGFRFLALRLQNEGLPALLEYINVVTPAVPAPGAACGTAPQGR